MAINQDLKFLQWEIENHIGILTINREDKLNALNSGVINELRSLLESCSGENLKGMIIIGAGEKAFVAGADISEMQGMSQKEAQEFANHGQQATMMLEELRIPVIAAVNGFALGGGCELALACDFIFATENAVFGLPEVSLGLIPGFGGTQRLARVIGRARAKEIVYTGRKVRAQEALEMGLCLKLAKNRAGLLEMAKESIELIARNSVTAVGLAKTSLNEGVDIALEEGLEVERRLFGEVFTTPDMQEGVNAFLEKRKPNFNQHIRG